MKDTDKSTDKAETRTLGSSIEQEVDAAFSALEPTQEDTPSWGEETLELSDAMIPNLTQANDVSTLPLPSENNNDEIIELTDVASVEETGQYYVEGDDDILELTEIVQSDLLKTETLELGDTSLDENDSGSLAPTDMAPMEEALELALDDDDDILELTDTVEPVQPESETPVVDAAFSTDDSDIIELTDMAPMEEALEPALDDDDDILELTDTVELVQPESEALADLASTLTIRGTDIPDAADVSPLDELAEPPAGEEAVAPYETSTETAEMEPSAEITADAEDDDIIDLADILDEQESGADGIEDEDTILQLDDILGKRPETTSSPAEETPHGPNTENAFNALGIVSDDMETEGLSSVSEQEVEAAVERIILKKYGASIETLIAKAVEKAVSREIDSIKRTIMEDDDPAG